ncbi:DNA-directed RNA polymerase V subunit 1 [Primulina huaijiensis]|uniref:DNA-directed RNA polymerase V subunit 1 n=1 Tax=Primulina huaijiensis TaxID=1492673 RepID=UPI003CC75293
MADSSSSPAIEGKIKGIRFGLATRQEICKASISDCPISHASQLSNPFLGLPLEAGKCESCGTGEPGQCEGHFGYVELPTPIYHPDHVTELKKMLSLLCLKCLKLKNRKVKNIGVLDKVLFSCCEETSRISINEVKTTDGAYKLELKLPSKFLLQEGFWTFLEKYGFRYGHASSRPLLPSEVMVMLRKIPQETRKKLEAKGYFPQDGYILQHLPVPPNCLSVPDISDGMSVTSTDYSTTLLKKVLKQVEVIKNSRSGMPNFESHEIEANDLQAAVAQYLEFRGTGKASRDVDTRFGVNKEEHTSSTKAWLAKMKTLFIRKGSGFSSRSVITGDPFKGVSEIGLPFEIAQKITFEERVSQHNMTYLQKLVDEKLCLTYRDGLSTYSLREGSKDHTFLRPGQVVHRRIMDGDIVFINRPPTTHKHSLQALSVYVHDDHTVKINPLICGPLSADFDGDCIHLFYPQSLEAKAEVVELFSVEKQLLSSHTGNFNLQLATDSLLSLKLIFGKYYLSRATSQQLAMFVPNLLPNPAVVKSKSGPLWTGPQILQTTLPLSFDCVGDKYLIAKSEVVRVDFSRDAMSSIVNDIVTSIFFLKGPKEVLKFFNSLQPLLMEALYKEGFSVSLRDLFIPAGVLENLHLEIQKILPLLYHLRAFYSESIALQLDNYLRSLKTPITDFVVKYSAIGHLVECKSESALTKVVQQIGFLGLQIADRGKFYSATLVKDMSSLFKKKYPSCEDHATEEFGLISRPLFRGLDPFQEMIHSISTREVTVRSTRGLTEPGTLFKNLMAILRDVVICYDNTVRNKCSNSVIQFEYGVNGANISSEFCPGDPVGVLAATAISNPAYKAVLDSSSNSNSSWEMMKEILLCASNFKNDISDRRVILYLNDCGCGRYHCRENAALIVKNQLKKVSLKETAIEFLIEYRRPSIALSHESNSGLIGHIHLNKAQLRQSNITLHDILEKCHDSIDLHRKKKKVGNLFKLIDLSCSECCTFCLSSKNKWTDVPCIQFCWRGIYDDLLERASHSLADTVCPVLLQTIIKGDPRVSNANIIWSSPDTATWIRSQCKSTNGEMALDVILEKEAVKKSGDAWRIVMDSCLPVIHLIDTRRSIPYAIKQVQELLGISCAFEQAVQRLSTSVTMVTKGVLKDHLLLLGNSMTCVGTLIGFNAGGVKSLSRSLSVEVPFTDATLFTPRKCFERAAEKCHVDALSSIVASCAWGKQVSVGTGSPFEILWDTRTADLKTEREIDVYDFLTLVINSSKMEDTGTDCLGEDIDDLELDDEYMGLDLSPMHESGLEKPSFEDEVKFDEGDDEPFSKQGFKEPQNSSWGNKVGSGWDNSVGSGWGNKADSGWDNKAGSALGDKVDFASGNKMESAWSNKVDSASGNKMESAWSNKVDSALGNKVESAWSNKVNSASGNKMESAWSNKVDSAFGENLDGQENDWTKKASQSTCSKEAQNGSTWGDKKDSDGGWENKDDQTRCARPSSTRPCDQSNLVKASSETYDQASHSKPSGTWGASNDWVKVGSLSPTQKQQKDSTDSKTWGSSKVDTSIGNDEQSQSSAGWNISGSGQDSDTSVSWSSWKKKTTKSDEIGLQPESKNADYSISSTGGDSVDVGSSKENLWESKMTGEETKPSNAWGSSNDWGMIDSQSPTEQKVTSHLNNWGSSQKQSNDSPRAQGWGSGEKDVRSQRGRGGRSRGRGPSNAGDWKNRPRPVKPVDDPNSLGIFTATRQRLDSFTVEEQDVLSEIEPIMKNIRRVMHQTGYNDGDPLSADDQNYIVENVFNHHPDKAVKMGSGIDHIMVNKHGQFQDSRCFYAVSVDGGKEDFSYRKCLENYIRGKYPDQAEAFIAKYFKKPQPRAGWNRDRGARAQTPDDTSSLGGKDYPSPVDDSETPS